MAIPTTHQIKFSCGHTEPKDLSETPAGKRKGKASWLGKQFVCSKCFKQQGQQNLEKLNREILADAMGFEQEHNFAELQGSEKQVNWATKIRFEVLNDIIESDKSPTQQTQVFDAAKDLPHAGWWIDNLRDTSDLDVDDFIELITTAIDEQDESRVETENPF